MHFTGHIQKGKGRATTLGFPTINIPLPEDAGISGVFVGRTWIDGKCYISALFADEWRHLLESHLLDFQGVVNESEVTIEVVEKIRDTKKFENDTELQETIARDVKRVREYEQKHPLRVMVFGTFDGVHEGHRDLLRQARGFYPQTHLVVSVARDEVVARVKGVKPQHKEAQRARALRAEVGVNEVVLGDLEGYVPHVQSARPDVIALGYDQQGEYVQTLEADLQAVGLSPRIVRLAPFRTEVYKSSMLKQPASKYMGVDYGARRIGLALSDSEGRLAFPLAILETSNKSVEEVVARAVAEKAGRIVVGDTRTLEGFENTVTERAEQFIQELAKSAPVPVERFNEAFATNEALRFAPQGKKHDDSSAAAIILQRYLDMRVQKYELE